MLSLRRIGAGISDWLGLSDTPSAYTGLGGEFIKVKATEDGLETDPLVKDIEFVIDGGGAAISTGIWGDLEIPYACTITQVTLLADRSGSIKIDIWKDTYANFPPTNADTITGGNEPEISGATKDQDATLASWTTAIAAGDILRFNVDSCATIERVTIALKVSLP